MIPRIRQEWSFPSLLLLLTLLSYGLLIPWLGFYWDDWPSIWFLNFLGPEGFSQVFASDRPLLGWLFRLTTPLFGTTPWVWQVFGLLARWSTSLAFWWALRGAWPHQPRLTAWTTVFFTVYPGFLQQSISVTYSHVFIYFTLFLLSLGASTRAIKNLRQHWLLALFSLASSAYTMFALEYFFGLELLRPIFGWLALRTRIPEVKKRARHLLLAWLPFLLIITTFLVWRIRIQETPRGEVTLLENLAAEPLATMIDLAGNVFSDMVDSAIVVWVQAADLRRLQGNSPAFIAANLLLTVVVAAAAIYLFYRSSKKSSTPLAQELIDPPGPQTDQPKGSTRDDLVATVVGTVALFVGGWPFWATNLPIDLRFPWDRFTLAMMPGASLFLAGLLGILPVQLKPRAMIAGVLVGLAIGFHYQNANLYRREWSEQRDFFWQLAWRAPAIQPGTAIFASELPFTYFSDNSLTAPLNWIYSPASLEPQMPYSLLALESRLGASIPTLAENIPIELPYRATEFRGSTSQVLVLIFTPPGCVHIFDPQMDDRWPQKPKYMSEAMHLSKPELILMDSTPAQPPAELFGSPPSPNWCYYYEKASLARQAGDWKAAAQFADQALGLDVRLYEVNAPELAPYIEAYGHTNEWEQALQLSRKALDLTPRVGRLLCDTWQRLLTRTQPSSQRDSVVGEINSILECSQ